VTVGVLVVRKLSRKAEQFTPQGLVDQVSGLGGAIKAFGAEIREGMASREEELRQALALDDLHPNGRGGALDADAASRLAHDPNARWRGDTGGDGG
jgi:hypothetical protein